MPQPCPKCTTKAEPSPDPSACDAAAVLARCYAERAGEEALFRALLAERDLKPDRARFWVAVFERLSGGAGVG